MAQHNSTQSLQQSQSNQQQQQQQQNGVAQTQQAVAAATQQQQHNNNNMSGVSYPQHHYQMPGSVYLPTPNAHGGAIYSVMPATLPGNVFVNNVTANVNLHGPWGTHPAYIPAGQAFIPAGAEMQQNVATMEQVMQPIMSTQNNNTIPRNGNRRNRNTSNPRNGNSNRRNDYNQRNHLNSPVPQDIANANGLDANGQPLAQAYPHPYGFPQFACHQPQYFNHVTPQQVSHSQAQQATGAPLYLASMYPAPQFYNYPVLISPAAAAHMLPQAAPQSQEYQMGDERGAEATVIDQHGQPIPINVAGANLIPQQLWTPHEIPIEYQGEYHVMGSEHGEDINHNTAVSLTDSDTPSLMSPSGYSIHYDPNIQIIEAQQHMSSLQIYDQHGVVSEEELQQQLMQEHQADAHYPGMHEQVVMIHSHEMNLYDQEQVSERSEAIVAMHSPLHQQQQLMEQHNVVYQEQYQQIEPEECYQQSQFTNEVADENAANYCSTENLEFVQNVPNLQENGLQHTNEHMTNANENFETVEQKHCEIQNSAIASNNMMPSQENTAQYVPVQNKYHSSPDKLPVGNESMPETPNLQMPPPPLQQQSPTQMQHYQPIITPSTQSKSEVLVVQQPVALTQPKIINYVPAPQQKKATASVAVTATPTQQHITTHIGLSSQQIAPIIKSDINANTNLINPITVQPKLAGAASVSVQPIPTGNVATQNNNATMSGMVSHRGERRSHQNVVEQKSIGSTAVPHQIQENNQYHQTNAMIAVESRKPEPPMQTDQNTRTKLDRKDDDFNFGPAIVAKETETKAIATAVAAAQSNVPQSTPSQMANSWASLFTAKPTHTTTVPNNNNNNNPPLVSTSTHTTVNKKPIAKVLPFEGTVNVQQKSPGTLSYSAASAQGVQVIQNKQQSASNNQSVASVTSTSSVGLQNGPVTKPNQGVKSSMMNQQIVAPAVSSVAESAGDEWTIKYADFLKKYKTDFSPISLKPRGLKNPNNYCFINAVLQALIGCSPLYNLLKSAPKQSAALHLDKSKIPTINAMSQLISDFNTLPAGVRLMTRRDRTQVKQNQKQNVNNNDELVGELQTDSSFEASSIYKLWNGSRPDVDEGRQGDAEEFLSYVLNKLNDEMLEIIKLMAKPTAPVAVQQNGNAFGDNDEGADDDWQMIYNNRNKGSVTRQADFGKTPISDIFRGELRSRLQREGEHSTDVIQPFFTLQLNIEKAGSVREALEILVGRDQLEGVTCSKTNQEVVAWQQMNLEKLPLILTVHLKFFDYKSDGCTKIVKQFEFPLELKIDTKILASKKYTAKQKLYRLFAVVYHDGKEAIKGHYISDVYHSGYSNWLRYDDANVKPISENNVLHPRGLRVPYLLFYRRCDTIPAVAATATTQTSATTAASVGQQQSQQQQHGPAAHSK